MKGARILVFSLGISMFVGRRYELFPYAKRHLNLLRTLKLIDSLEWVYDNYPRGKEAQLLETMQLVRDSGFSWKNDWYTEANFPKTAVTQGFSQQTY